MPNRSVWHVCVLGGVGGGGVDCHISSNSAWNGRPWPGRSQNWMLMYFIINLSGSQQFSGSSIQNQVELSEWATGRFMHCSKWQAGQVWRAMFFNRIWWLYRSTLVEVILTISSANWPLGFGIIGPFKWTGNHTYLGLKNNWGMQSKNGLQNLWGNIVFFILS